MKNYKKLLEEKEFQLNSYPEGRFWELIVTDSEKRKLEICRAFGAIIDLDVNGTDINTLILQCAEDFTKCVFYYDCNPFDVETNEFLRTTDMSRFYYCNLFEYTGRIKQVGKRKYKIISKNSDYYSSYIIFNGGLNELRTVR